MKTIKIHGNTGESIILIGERLENLKAYLPVEKPVIITDTNVQDHYQELFPEDIEELRPQSC